MSLASSNSKFLLHAFVLLTACGGGGGSDSPDAALTADAAVLADDANVVEIDAGNPAEPVIETVTCRFAVPESLGLNEGAGYECGDLIVPENRANPSATIRVHFVRFFSPAVSENATIYFEGGPGGSGSGMVARLGILGGDYLDGLMVDGDFIVIAQRGTSLSVPFLDCDNADDCLQISDDLSSYNTAYNADDVDDLRSTLGYEKLNIYGISYGSRLALEVLRRHGEHIRSAVVGGLVPSQVIWTAGIPAGIDGALTKLNQSCAASGACGVAYGDLYAKFIAGVYDLQKNPISLDNGAIDLDGSTYASLVFRLMYARSSYPWLPMVISDLAERQTGRIESFLVNAINASGNSSIALGMYYSVVCGEMFSPPDPDAFETLNAGVPQDMQDIFGGGYYYSREVCRTWPNGPLQTSLAAPVSSAIPTFVASGEMDPVTPPNYGQTAADTLSNSLVVIYANSGHGATVQTECGRQTFLAFLANPDTEIDVSCAETLTTDYVLPSSAAPVAQLSRETLAMELQLAPAPPHMMDAIRQAIKN